MQNKQIARIVPTFIFILTILLLGFGFTFLKSQSCKVPQQAIVFDLNGVLFKSGKDEALEILQNQYKYDKHTIQSVIEGPTSEDWAKGLTSDQEFWDWAKTQLPSNYDIKIIREVWLNSYKPDMDAFNLLLSLKPNYKIVAFSGNFPDRIQYLDAKYHFRKYFDLEVYSYDYKLNKPDIKFTEAMLKKVSLPPAQVTYFDNDEINIKNAKKLGINAILYTQSNLPEVKKALHQLCVVVKN